MRATVFQAPLELKLSTEGETWNQEDDIKGDFEIISHNNDPLIIKDYKMGLAIGNLKKVKNKDPAAFEIISEITFEERSIAAQAKEQFLWSFSLEKNCTVSTKKESLFLIFGSDLSQPAGHLQLQINAHPHIQEFLKVFETFFRFRLKEFKNQKASLEAVMTPAAAKDFASLDAFSCIFKFSEQAMDINYEYKLRVLANAIEGATIDKKKKSIKATLPEKEYLFGPNAYNQDGFRNHQATIIEKVKVPKLF